MTREEIADKITDLEHEQKRLLRQKPFVEEYLTGYAKCERLKEIENEANRIGAQIINLQMELLDD